jgi:hypothetical protein
VRKPLELRFRQDNRIDRIGGVGLGARRIADFESIPIVPVFISPIHGAILHHARESDKKT